MSLTTLGSEPQPSLAWTFESSNVDYVTNLSPSSQVSPGPAQLQGSAVLTNTAPTSNTAVYFPGTSGSYMNLGTSSPASFNLSTSNLFVEAWVYFTQISGIVQVISSRANTGVGGYPSGHDWVFYLDNDSKIKFFLGNGSVYSTIASSSTTIQASTWIYVAVSYYSLTSAYIFINGTATGPTSLSTFTPVFNTYPFLIGYGAGSYILNNSYIRDLRVVQGGVVPTASFTPASAPFSYALPSYVTGSGTTVFTLLGQFITYVPGKYGSAIKLTNYLTTSPQNYISYDYQNSFDTYTGMSICFWMKVDKFKGTNEFVLKGYRFYAIIDTNKNVEILMINNTGQYRPINFNSPLVTDTWYHVAYTSNGGTVTGYLNGLSRGTRSDASTQGVSTETYIRIGWFDTGQPGVDAFFDDLRIYNTALTAAQVQSIYTQGGAPASQFRSVPQPSLAWSFDGTTTSYIGGLSPTSANVNGTYQSTTTWPYYNTSGKFGSSLYLYNSNAPTTVSNCIFFNQSSGINIPFGGSNTSTLCFWYKFLNAPGGVIDNTLVFLTRDQGNKTSYILAKNPSTVIGSYGNFSGTAAGIPNSGSSQVTVGTWYHVAQTTTNTTQTLYVNGTFVGSLTYTAINGDSSNVWNCMSLGTYFFGTNPSAGASCELDDLRIYNTALSAAQVQSIYQAQGMPSRGVQVSKPISQRASGTIIGAYSTKLINPFWSGAVLNIQRTSDGTSTDLYGDFYGNLRLSDGTNASSWIGASQANVNIWYDQSGNSLNAVKTTANQYGLAPRLVTDPGGSGQLVIFFPNQNSSNVLYYGFSIATQAVAGVACRFRVSSGKINDTAWESLVCTVNDNQGVRLSSLNLNQGDGNDFLNPGGFATSNGTYKNTSPFATVVRDTWYNLIASRASGSLNMVYIGHCSPAWGSPPGWLVPRSLYGYMTDLVTYSTQLVSSNYDTIYAPYITPLQGTPLFSQLSQAATSSAVGAFSLRAVNGTSAKAVNVRPVAALPVVGFTSSATQSTNQFTQTLTGYPFGGAGSYTANCSSFASDGNQPRPWKAFDYDTATWWENNYAVQSGYNGIGATSANTYSGSYTTTVSGSSVGGEWLQLGLPTAIVLYSYSMYNRIGYNGYRMPYAWTVAGSNDGSTWTTVDTETGIIWTSATQTFTTTSTTPYLYFRLIVQAIQSNGNSNQPVNIGQWTLYGSNASWQTDFYADRLGNLLTAPVTGQTLASWLGGATGYVTTWYDQSAAGNHATQATAANQPVIQQATKGPGYATVWSGAVGPRLVYGTTSNLFDSTNYSVCVVAKRNATITGATYYTGTNGQAVQNQSLALGYNTDTALRHSEYSYSNNGPAVPAYAGASEPMGYDFFAFSQTALSGFREYSWRSGTQYSSGNNTLTLPLTNSGNATIGWAASAAGGNSFNGEIYEVLVFTKSLYDLDNTGGLITQIYNNQLSYTGT